MADTKISALSAASALAGTEVAPVVQSAATVKATIDQIKTYVLSGNNVYPGNGALSSPASSYTGTWITGGTGTTTKPYFLIEPTGTTSNNWNTNGSGFGLNAASGFSGYLMALQVAATNMLVVTAAGAVTAAATVQAGVSSYLGWNGRSLMSSPADSRIMLSNSSADNFDRLQFGGTTSSFPALKRSTTLIQGRLADDSNFCTIQGLLRTAANAVAETPLATHTILITDAAGTGYKVLAVAA